MTVLANNKTKQLVNKLVSLWDELSPDKKKEYRNFEDFFDSQIKPLAFHERAELERFLIKWLGLPDLREDFGNDFLAFVFFTMNKENTQITPPKVKSYNTNDFKEGVV